MTLMRDFGTEDKCREYLEKLRWPVTVKCPRCDSISISRIVDRGQYDCNSCRYQFSVTSGTIMHDTHLSLWKWFAAVYLITESKKGISANQLSRTLEMTYKTSWYLCHRIRKALQTPHALLTGVCEVDETYVGGKRKKVKGGYVKNKAMVLGAIERGGKLTVRTANRRTKVTLRKFITDTIGADAVAIFTDDNPAYTNIIREYRRHETVNHSKEEWVRGDVHTNTVENAWSLFKRSLIGAFHKVSHKHLDLYLDEFEYKFNNRDNPLIFRDALKELLTAESVPYAELVA